MSELAPAPAPSLWIRLLLGAATILSCTLAGALLGGLYVKLFVPRKAMGWDGLADTLGGLMLGALIGMVAGLLIVALLSRRAQLAGLATAVAVVVAVVAFMAVTAPRRQGEVPESPPQPTPDTPTQPAPG